MDIYIKMLLLLLTGYLFGSLNFSIIFTKIFAKTDVRNHGSGNAGFTNTLRTAGKGVAILVFICDALKAIAAMIIATMVSDNPIVVYAAAIGSILGHNFPLYYHFRGGKGIVVSIAILFFIDWRIACIILGAFLVVLFISGFVSLGSITGAVLLPITTAIFYKGNISIFVFSLIIAVLAIFMHRGNIKRLISGTENGFRRKKNG